MFPHQLAQHIASLQGEVERLEALEVVGAGGAGGDFVLFGHNSGGVLGRVTNIPQTHRHLWCLVVGRSNNLPNTVTEVLWVINGGQNVEDTCRRFLMFSGSSNSLVTRPGIGCGHVPCDGATESSSMGMAWIVIPDYTETSYVKGVVGYGGGISGGATQCRMGVTNGYFDDTAGVTQVDATPNLGGWTTDSGLWVYGMA